MTVKALLKYLFHKTNFRVFSPKENKTVFRGGPDDGETPSEVLRMKVDFFYPDLKEYAEEACFKAELVIIAHEGYGEDE